MDTNAYFKRIGYHGTGRAGAAELHALQRAHLFSVPFENLDIHLGRPIRLEEAALFDKIVTRRRGGFCYELNGLFARLLENLGYQVRMLSATMPEEGGAYSHEYDHLALEVYAPDEPQAAWLVDVGFGDGPLAPLRMDDPSEQAVERGVFQFRADGEYQQLWERGRDGDWSMRYRYIRRPRAFTEFFDMCHYHQTSPESMFTQKRLISLYTPTGRATLANQTLILTDLEGHREERALDGEEAYRQELKERFGVLL